MQKPTNLVSRDCRKHGNNLPDLAIRWSCVGRQRKDVFVEILSHSLVPFLPSLLQRHEALALLHRHTTSDHAIELREIVQVARIRKLVIGMVEVAVSVRVLTAVRMEVLNGSPTIDSARLELERI